MKVFLFFAPLVGFIITTLNIQPNYAKHIIQHREHIAWMKKMDIEQTERKNKLDTLILKSQKLISDIENSRKDESAFIEYANELEKNGKCSRFNENFSTFFRDDISGSFKEFSSVRHKKEILVAVIDTGYDFNNKLMRKAVPRKYLKNISKLNFSNSKVHVDVNGHGTHVASILIGIMPQVKILPLKFYNPRNTGNQNLQATIDALNFAIDANVDLINYSGGGPIFSEEEFKALKRAEKAGIIVFAAAGNKKSNINNKDKQYFPASYNLKNVVVVGNQTRYFNDLEIQPSSNHGKKVDFYTKGQSVKAFVPGCTFSYMTGTSQATPMITATFATLKAQYPNASFNDIYNHIKKTSVKKTATLALEKDIPAFPLVLSELGSKNFQEHYPTEERQFVNVRSTLSSPLLIKNRNIATK